MSLTVYKVVFMAELLVAEFLFTLRLKRRSKFWLRFAAMCAVGLLLAWQFPIVSYNAFYSSVMFLALFAATVGGLMLCYNESFVNIAYCAVAAYTMRHMSFQFYSLYITLVTDSGATANAIYGSSATTITQNTAVAVLAYFLCYFIVYTLCYTFFARRIAQDGEFVLRKPTLLIWVVLILFVDIVLNAVVVYNSNEQNFLNAKVLYVNVITTYVYNILCCFFMLFIQFIMIDVQKLKRDLEVTNHIWLTERKQYQISKENIDLINRKCHDLKYQIGQIVAEGGANGNTVKEVESMIDIYDSMLKTGNEALDVIFAEKSLLCRKNDIKLNCMIDGARLSFMETADIYVLFGNLMDNAMEAVEKLSDVDKRIVSVNVYVEQGLLHIVMSNYYTGNIEICADGMPQTTKADKDFHGIGMRSVSLIVEHYGGNIDFTVDDGIFTVDISFATER